MIHLIHTADVHLGRKFALFGDFGKTVRAQIRETFTKVLALAPARGAAAVLIAGDLFDEGQPDAADQRFVLQEIGKLRPIPVIVLPGTHDLFALESVWVTLVEKPDNLFIVDQDPWQHHIAAASLTVHGRPNRAKRGGEPPLAGIAPDPRARLNVALAHASVERGDIGSDPDHDYFVTARDLNASGMQYCALGHWHAVGPQLPEAQAVAWYCGTPEPVQFPEGEGEAVGVALEIQLEAEKPAQVLPRPVGHYRWRQARVDVSHLQSPGEVSLAIEGLAAVDCIARVRLHGTLASQAAFDPDALHESLAGRFAHLILETGGTRTRWEDFDPTTVFPPGTVGAAFVSLAQAQLQTATPETRPILEEVLRRGTALLAGREDA